jgi:hypothetical protein
MSFQQYGSTDYTFGFDDPEAESIATAVGLKPQTLSISGEPEFTAEAKNLDGMTESFVVGDNKFTFTMSGFVVDRSKLDDNASFEYDGRFFIVTGHKLDIANTDFQKGEVTGVSYPLITS